MLDNEIKQFYIILTLTVTLNETSLSLTATMLYDLAWRLRMKFTVIQLFQHICPVNFDLNSHAPWNLSCAIINGSPSATDNQLWALWQQLEPSANFGTADASANLSPPLGPAWSTSDIPVALPDPVAMSNRGWITSILNTPFFCHRFNTRTILLCEKGKREYFLCDKVQEHYCAPNRKRVSKAVC